MSKRETIYVYLRNEGVDVWRPVEAEPLGNQAFRIPADTAVPEEEEWGFSPGDAVRCALKTRDGQEILVAIELV